MGNYLDAIVERKKQEVETLILPPKFSSVLKDEKMNVIAEIKRRSPVKGILSEIIDPVALAKRYIDGGAIAISVLTDGKGFGGSLHDLRQIAEAFPSIPLLRKDFIVDPRQVIETARSGACAILLIAAVLQDNLISFIELAHCYHLEALVEVHDLEELNTAVSAGAQIIGVNSRNLKTFEIDLAISCKIAEHIPSQCIKIAESGIQTVEDAQRMRQAGFDAVLVGEALVKAQDPSALIRSFQC